MTADTGAGVFDAFALAHRIFSRLVGSCRNFFDVQVGDRSACRTPSSETLRIFPEMALQNVIPLHGRWRSQADNQFAELRTRVWRCDSRAMDQFRDV
jgi:hypothetical protein